MKQKPRPALFKPARLTAKRGVKELASDMIDASLETVHAAAMAASPVLSADARRTWVSRGRVQARTAVGLLLTLQEHTTEYAVLRGVTPPIARRALAARVETMMAATAALEAQRPSADGPALPETPWFRDSDDEMSARFVGDDWGRKSLVVWLEYAAAFAERVARTQAIGAHLLHVIRLLRESEEGHSTLTELEPDGAGSRSIVLTIWSEEQAARIAGSAAETTPVICTTQDSGTRVPLHPERA